MFSPLEQFNVFPVTSLVNLVDSSFVNIMLPLVIVIITITVLSHILRSSAEWVPTKLQYVTEHIADFVVGVVKQQVGREGYTLFPLVLTIFTFIIICNYISLLPMGIAITSHIIVTLLLSLGTCLSIFILGLKEKGINFFKLFVPQAPLLLLPMLMIIEMFSYVLRAFSLAIRLSANILAGHTLVHIIALAVFSITTLKL